MVQDELVQSETFESRVRRILNMGCGGSKAGGDRNERQEDEQPPPQQEHGAGSSEDVSMPAPGLQRRRSSISHKAVELDGSGRKVSTTFDSAKICALTCHGIAPARGVSGVSSKAKINQDRGVVCWPFNSSHNQALLCIFDGHGLQGEVVSQWCMTQLPIRLEAVRDVLATNPPRALSETVIDAASTSTSSHVAATCLPLACLLAAHLAAACAPASACPPLRRQLALPTARGLPCPSTGDLTLVLSHPGSRVLDRAARRSSGWTRT